MLRGYGGKEGEERMEMYSNKLRRGLKGRRLFPGRTARVEMRRCVASNEGEFMTCMFVFR